jgi:hypothetical protein
MISSKQVFKAGLCTIFGAVAFSLFFWNGYMTTTGRFMVWNAIEGDTALLMFILFLMPLLIGLPSGFGMIFYSFHLENKEHNQIIYDRIAEREKLLENKDLTSLERIDIILGNKNT